MDASEADPLGEAERTFLRALNELGVRYLLVGMSAALLQGARGATEDLDLWFEDIADERIGQAARRAGSFWITRTQPPMLGGKLGDRIDVVLTLSGLPRFVDEYHRAVQAEIGDLRIPMLPLARILHSKRTAGRIKDAAGIQQIELAMAVAEKLDE